MCHILLLGSDTPLQTFASGGKFGPLCVTDEIALTEADYRDDVPGKHIYSVGVMDSCACNMELWNQGLEEWEREGEEPDALAVDASARLKDYLASLRGIERVWLLHVWEGEEYDEILRVEATVEELFQADFLFEEGTLVEVELARGE